MVRNKETFKNKMRESSKEYYRVMPRILGRLDNWGEGCWNYLGNKNYGGYGLIGYAGKTVLVHRLTYELCYGEFDKKLCVLHKCDNRSCVNPYHLFLGTKSDNMVDCAKKKRQYRQRVSQLYCKRGHELFGNNLTFSGSKKRGKKYRVCKKCRSMINKQHKLKLKQRYNLEGEDE